MRRFRELPCAALVLGLLAASCDSVAVMVAEDGNGPGPMKPEVFVSGLTDAVAMAIAADGHILITQQTGEVRVYRPGSGLDPVPVVTVTVGANYEAGLLGIALAPDFTVSRQFYILYVAPNGASLRVSVARLDTPGGTMLTDPLITIPINPAAVRHYGGNLHFDPTNAYLFVTVGDATLPNEAQDTSNPMGSLLRYYPDGSIPPGNPFGVGNPVWAYGLRNSFDFTFRSDGTIFATENGNTENDEVNILAVGENYGWPDVKGYCDDFPSPEAPCTGMTDPIWEFRNVNAPTGIIVYEGTLLPDINNDLLMGSWNDGVVYRLLMNVDDTVASIETFFTPEDGSGITDLEVGPDDAIYVLVRNGGYIYRLGD